MLGEPFYEDTIQLILSDRQTILRSIGWGDEQVLDLLIVDLYHRASDFKADLGVCVLLDSVKNLIAS